MKKIIFLMLFTALSWQQAVAQQFTDGTLWYNVFSGTTTVEVAAKNKAATGTDIAIPEQVSYNGTDYTVASIGANAFQFDYLLTSVTIPNSIQSIGNGAFQQCFALTSITIPNSVFRIGDNAFEYCGRLKSVTIGNSVRGIDNAAFYGCSALSAIDIPNSVTSIGQSAFSGCHGLTSVTIPADVQSIGSQAFNSCRSLTSVVCNIATPLTINADTFQNSNPDCSLIVPASSVAAYQAKAVWQNFNAILCYNQATINTTTASACGSYTWAFNNQTYTASGVYYSGLPGDCLTEKLDLTVTTAFSDNNINYVFTSANTVAVGNNQGASGSITIPASVTNSCGTYPVTSISDSAFQYSSGLTSITIPDSVTSISNSAFNGCSGLTSITIPNAVTSIGRIAFLNCSGLKSINIPNSVANIGDFAFLGCHALSEITVNWTAPIAINNEVFHDLNLSTIALKVPAGTELDYDAAPVWTNFNLNGTEPIIGQTFAFGGINYIVTKATAPYEVAVGNNAGFIGAATIEANVTYAGNSFAVTSINSSAFYECDGLTAVTIPNTVTSIGNLAFAHCNGLNSITVPNSVTILEEEAFYACRNLTSINLSNAITSIGRQTFLACDKLAAVNIPNSVTSIGQGAFSQCKGLTSITIPNSVESIGDAAFEHCTGLKEVIVNWVDPIDINSDVFYRLELSFIALKVPVGSELAYDQAAVWTDFNLNGKELTGQTFAVNGINYIVTKGTSPYEVAVASNTTFVGSATIPANVTNNGNSFAVTSIAAQAFYECQSLTSVTIPNSVLRIGDAAFAGCFDLAAVTVNWTTPIRIMNRKFDGYPFEEKMVSIITLNVPAGTKATYQKSDWYGFNIVEPVTTIFNYCRNAVATPLVAPFATGSTVRWYTVATGGRALTTVPTPLTTTVGTKLFYVSQVVGGVESARETITVNTIALPATPATITGAASQGALVGTYATANYSIANVADAVSYVWTAPTGVNIVEGQGTNSVTVNFADVPSGVGAIGNLSVVANNSNDCRSLVRNLALTKALPATPTAIKMTDDALPIPDSGIATAVTSFAKYMGTDAVLTLTATAVATASSYEWELPEGVTLLSDGTSNVITVNFAGVNRSNTHNYTTTAGVLTHVLRIGVKAINGAGSSVTTNNSAIEPTTSSTARLLTLNAVLPAAPTAIKMSDAAALDPSKSVTNISSFIGTTKELTLTATPSVAASSYSWELPAGVNQTSGGNTNVITVDFAGVGSGITTLYIGVKAVNGIGTSVTTNAAPNAASTAKLLKLTATIPSAVTAVSGQITNLCGLSSYNYSITPSSLATSYLITAPAGSVVTSASNMSNDTHTLSTSDVSFMVIYPNGVVATKTTPKSIVVTAVNGVGSSLANKTLALSTLVPAIGTPTGGTTFQRASTQFFSVPAIVGVTNYTWTAVDGAVITDGQGTNSVTVDFSAVPLAKTTNKLTVVATNACGLASVARAITLKSVVPSARNAEATTLAISTTEVYPNPVSSNFNIDVTASKAGTLTIATYSLDGILVSGIKTVALLEGTNTISEIVAGLKTGVYILQLVNTSNNEVITKKLIKE